MGEVEEAASLEVAHAYGSSLAVAIGFLQSPPRAKHVAIGLMNEQQVDVLSLQLAQALVDALGGLLLARIWDPHLRHDKQVFAPYAALAPGISHAFLVVVGLRRVDKPVAHMQGIGHAAFTLIGRDHKHAIAQQGHFNSIW